MRLERLSEDAEKLRWELVQVCRVLVEGRLDSGPFGNVSVRIPGTSEYWQNPAGITFDALTPQDVIRVDAEGKVIEGNHSPHPGEFIHREIYRLRRDVQAIVHTHSHSTVMLSLLGKSIEPFTQVGAALYGDQGIYLGYSGPVRDTDEGNAIAKALAQNTVVIAKNHGLFATGKSLSAAWWDMVVADLAAKIHVDALKMGLSHADPLSLEVAEKSRREVRHRQYQAMWQGQVAKLKFKYPELFCSERIEKKGFG